MSTASGEAQFPLPMPNELMDNSMHPAPPQNAMMPSPKQQNDATRPSGTMRWLSITARTSHIAVTAVLFGGFILYVPFSSLTQWHSLTIATGCLLLVLEWLHDRRWLHRAKGLLGLLHLSLCLLIHFLPNLAVPLLWAILITGCIGSHMPRRYRHWSFLEGWEQESSVRSKR